MADEPSNWRLALDARDLETLRLIVLLVQEHHELTGSWITASALRDKLRRPGL